MKMLMMLVAFVAMAMGAPQFDPNNDQPTPYSFSYGVSDPETGDEKEHKETLSPSGAVEGEFKWLQPNGLYRTTRYTADDVSGFQAIVSEEPSERVANYYVNSLSEEAAQSSITDQRSQQAFTSIQSGNTGIATQQNIQRQQPSRVQNLQVSRVPSFTPQNVQTQAVITSTQNEASRPSFTSPQNTQSQAFTTFANTQTSQNAGNIIDGGIIDGGIIDGGIIGSTSSTLASRSNSFSSNTNTFTTGANLSSSRISTSNTGLTSNRFGSSQASNSNANQGVAVILARNPNQLRN